MSWHEFAEYRHVPYDVEVEQALLGAILVDNQALERVGALIRPEHFYDPLHARIFETMTQAVERGSFVLTPLTLHAAMKADPGLIEVGGTAYLEGLGQAAPALPNVADYARILYALALRRFAFNACQEASQALHDTNGDVATILRDIMVVADMASTVKSRPVPVPDVIRGLLTRAERALGGDRPPAVTTGLSLLDDALEGGLQGTDLMVMPGRPGSGKSACLGAIGMRAALAGFPTLAFSIEMSSEQWLARCITDLDYDEYPGNPMAYTHFRSGKLTVHEIERAMLAGRRLDTIPMEICDSGDMTVEDITARARAFKAKHSDKLGLIVVDYLQKVAPSGGRDRSREQEVAHVAAGLKRLAKALNWPVAAGAQILTKGADPRSSNKEILPTLAAIRESGAIEAEADIIAAPHRKAWFVGKEKPDAPDDSPEMEMWRGQYRAVKNQMKLLGLKFRHGAEFSLDLHVNMASSSIRDEKPSGLSPAVAQAQADMLRAL